MKKHEAAMSLLTFILSFGKKTVETVTLAEIEARLNEKAKLEEMEHRAAAIIPYGYTAPPGVLVIDNSTSPVEVARNAGMVTTDFMIYDRNGHVPADEWARLDREGEQYLANLPPMPRDPKTGRPTRD